MRWPEHALLFGVTSFLGPLEQASRQQKTKRPNILKCCMEINYPKDKMLKVCYIHITRFRVKQFIHTK